MVREARGGHNWYQCDQQRLVQRFTVDRRLVLRFAVTSLCVVLLTCGRLGRYRNVALQTLGLVDCRLVRHVQRAQCTGAASHTRRTPNLGRFADRVGIASLRIAGVLVHAKCYDFLSHQRRMAHCLPWGSRCRCTLRRAAVRLSGILRSESDVVSKLIRGPHNTQLQRTVIRHHVRAAAERRR